MLLCRRHHRLVHEGGYTVRRDGDGTLTFMRPNGWLVEAVPPPARWERDKGQGQKLEAQPDGGMAVRHDPLEPTLDRLAGLGIVVDAHTAPCWDGTPFNVGYVIDALRGHEPLLPRGRVVDRGRVSAADVSRWSG
jgi:hypothetical protein